MPPSPLPIDRRPLLDAVAAIAVRAGIATLPFYEGDAGATVKSDGSPVTLADAAAEAVILPALHTLCPEVPAISEEAAERGENPGITAGGPFWLIDPLDGTKEFLKRNGEFTVNIALIEDGRPTLGVVYTPVARELYAGLVRDGGAWRQVGDGPRLPIACRPRPSDGVIVATSRSHADDAAVADWLANWRAGGSAPVRVAGRLVCGSSIKFCRVAEGAADLYPRFGPTCEWDTAAGHAVLLAAGGGMTTPQGAPFLYGKPGFRNGGFIAHGL